MSTTPKRDRDAASIRSDRLAAALDRAIDGESADLFDLLHRSSGLPGVRPNLELARAVGAAIASRAARGDRLLAELAQPDAKEYLRIVAAMTLIERTLLPSTDRKRAASRTAEALADLQQIAEDPRHLVRLGVVAALRARIDALGEPAVEELAAWTDGYLQAHVALEALADRPLLDKLPSHEPVLARLEEAFVLADESPRAAERSQGMRSLRQGLPAQIATFATRYGQAVLSWIESKTASKRPETRDVVASAINTLRRSVIGDVEARRLSGLLEASGKPPRDPTRVIQGMRNRGKGRR